MYGEEAPRFNATVPPAEGRRALRRLVEHDHVDLIKVVYSSIPGNVPRLGRNTLEVLIAESHGLQRRVFAHVSTAEEAAACIAAGVDGLEHMMIAYEQALDNVLGAAGDQGVFSP